jgi:hypothetical protein
MSASTTSSTTYADASLLSSEDASGGAGLAKRQAAKKKPSAKPWQPPKRGKARSFTQPIKKPATRSLPYVPYVRHGNKGKTTRPSRVQVSQSLRDVYMASDLQLVKTVTASGHLQDASVLCFWGAWGCRPRLIDVMVRRGAVQLFLCKLLRGPFIVKHATVRESARTNSIVCVCVCEGGIGDVHAVYAKETETNTETEIEPGGHRGREEHMESTRSCACVDGGVCAVV